METQLKFEDLQIGEEYGPLHYVVTQEKIELFRQAVGYSESLFPTIASKDYAQLFMLAHRMPRVINAKHDSRYFRSPEAGTEVTVYGRLADKYIKRDRQFIVIESRSVDDRGEQLVTSKTTLMLAGE